ncbi:hypothetical protein TcasGA2_TC008745 [Tribolium castaneum]|uniref:Uncharacterized protein n=1 Tax=Tribolium castaneum TaxID=7070 RepID=D6WS66_TRICA|nr:hypothetical protein TcasGA2_TC008745 [Tribolium castaneum]
MGASELAVVGEVGRHWQSLPSVFTRPWRAWRDSTGAAYFDAVCSFEGVELREETKFSTLRRQILARLALCRFERDPDSVSQSHALQSIKKGKIASFVYIFSYRKFSRSVLPLVGAGSKGRSVAIFHHLGCYWPFLAITPEWYACVIVSPAINRQMRLLFIQAGGDLSRIVFSPRNSPVKELQRRPLISVLRYRRLDNALVQIN